MYLPGFDLISKILVFLFTINDRDQSDLMIYGLNAKKKQRKAQVMIKQYIEEYIRYII